MNKQKRYFARFLLPLILYLILIFFLSSLPGKEIPDVELPYFDKLLHLLEYAVLGFLLMRGLKNSELKFSNISFIIFTAIFSTLYGLSDESHQSFVPNRDMSLFDVLFDCIGGVIGSIVYRKN
ncbi:VanZ family protein [bacterium]|nr:VanZ family protein [bacterium]